MRNSTKSIIILAPVLIASISIGAYYFLSKPDDVTKIEHSTSPIESTESTDSVNGIYTVKHNSAIFPHLTISTFYKNLRVREDGTVYMDDNFAAAVINYVIDHANYGDGNIKWGYSLTDTNLDLTFKWFSGKTEYEKSYNLSLIDSN